MSTRKLVVMLVLAGFACFLAVPSFADSQARIVRLSQVEATFRLTATPGRVTRRRL